MYNSQKKVMGRSLRRRGVPKSEILVDKRILAVGYDNDIVDVIDEVSFFGGCDVTLLASANVQDALQHVASYPYDLLILHMESVPMEEDVLRVAEKVGIPTVVLTARSFSPEDLKKSVEMRMRAYLPLDALGSVIPVLEDVIKLNPRVKSPEFLGSESFAYSDAYQTFSDGKSRWTGRGVI